VRLLLMHFCSGLLMYFQFGVDPQHVASLFSGKLVNLDCANQRRLTCKILLPNSEDVGHQSRAVTLMNSSGTGENSDKAHSA